MADLNLGGNLDVAIKGLFGTGAQFSYQAGVEVTDPAQDLAPMTDYEFEIVSNRLVFQGDIVHVQIATTLDTEYSTSYLRVRGMNISTDDDRVSIYTDYDFDANVCTYTQNQWYDAWNFGGGNDTAVRMALRFGTSDSTIRTWTASTAEMNFGVSEENFYSRFTVPWSSWSASGGVIPQEPMYVGGNFETSGDNPVVVSTINNNYSQKANSTYLIFPDFSQQTTYNDMVTYVTNYANDVYPDLLPDIVAAIPVFDDFMNLQYQPNNYFELSLSPGGSGGNTIDYNEIMSPSEFYDVLNSTEYYLAELDTDAPDLSLTNIPEPVFPAELSAAVPAVYNTGIDMLSDVGLLAPFVSVAVVCFFIRAFRG